ncbi:MAG: L-aspartate oxidase [Bacteroidetes bacterium]|nr:L-aspartate oxidase [Bacteroidota bacterium]
MKTDFLIVGSGIAGLSLAIKLSELGRVTIITKKQKAESNTNYAQGGIASVFGSDDTYDLHIQDTLDCGAGLCHLDAVEKIVTEGPVRIKELMELGVNFSKDHGHISLGKEGGHSRNRILHSKDLTGKEIERALLHKVASISRIKVYEYYFAIDLLTPRNLKRKKSKEKNICYGIYAYNVNSNKVEKIVSNYTILASGGLGQVYTHTTNPAIATGDGFAIGYRGGCDIANMEFVQFHPTALYENKEVHDSQVFLISEAVRGAGAILKNRDGKEFMHKYDKRKSLAPRDIVARAIDAEMKKRGDTNVFLDMRHIDKKEILNHFPNIYKHCLKIGIDVTKQMVPVVPAAHYSCGGIKTDLHGKTNVKNLFACGEVTMTGVHGANRLASNSLLEAVVFSNSISEYFKKNYKKDKKENLTKLYSDILSWNSKGTVNTEEWILISHNKKEIKEIMSDYVGIVRNTIRLQRANRRILMMKDEIREFYKKTKVSVELLELRNLVTVAALIIESAMKRKESRGLHYMLDYPMRDDKYFSKDTIITKQIKNN